MKPIHWAVAAAVFLVLAFVGAHFALEPGNAPGEGPPLVPGTGESASAPPAEVEPAIGAESLGTKELAAESESPERAAPETTDRFEVRSGAISGTVERAGLWARDSIRAFALPATPEGRTAREIVPRVFERAHESTPELEALAVAQALCDAAGGFSLTGLDPSQEYRVLLRAPGGVFIAKSAVTSVRTGASLEFEGHPSGPVRFEVTVPNSRTVARATLMNEVTPARECAWDWQPSDPPVWLSTGFNRIRARVEADWVEPRPEWSALQLAEEQLVLQPNPPSDSADAQPGLVRIELGLDPGLEVEVLDPLDQMHRMPCNVRVVPTEDAQLLEEPLPGLHSSWRFPAADRRWYDLRDTGEYIVRLVDDLGRVLDETRVEVLEGYRRATLTVPRIQAFETLAVDLRSPAGLPLEGAKLGRLGDPQGTFRRWSGEFRWSADRYVAPLASREEVPWPAGRDLEVELEHPEFGAHWLRVGPDDRELSFRFERPAVLTVGLLDEELQSPRVDIELRPQGEQLVLLESVTYAGLGHRRDTHDEVHFAPLTPARYLVVAKEARPGGSEVLAQIEVDLAPGESRTVDLTVSESSDLEVHAPHLSPGVTLSLRPLDGSGGSQWQEVPSGQRVTFTGLQPGEYELSAAVPSEALTITVPSSPIVAELHMPNGFLIGALDDDDPLRAAGLLPDDVIIAVGSFELALLVGGAPVDPEVLEDLEQATSVTVRRKGRRVDIDLGENLMSLSFRAQASLDGPREGYPWEQVYLPAE